jgi:hypothetical protein
MAAIVLTVLSNLFRTLRMHCMYPNSLQKYFIFVVYMEMREKNQSHVAVRYLR